MVVVRGGMEQAGGRSPPQGAPPPPPPQGPPQGTPTQQQQTNGAHKILGRNANGTTVVTAAPSDEAELQLYRVLQRASLLAYYDTLLEMGGDDVQQLCDAGEEEFLEIMALVGMASKPLHVRRLQKALHEWATNPAMFQMPILPNICPTDVPFLACRPRVLSTTPVTQNIRTVRSPELSARPAYSPSPGIPESSCGSNSSAPNSSPVHNTVTITNNTQNPKPSVTPIPIKSDPTLNSESFSPSQVPACPTSAGSSPSSINCSPVQITPCLLDVQIQRLSAAAERLSRHLPNLEPRPHNAKKKMCKDLEAVMMMPDADPRRMEEIRKYAAIYGRFDCKRKPEKPLTLHEVSVNEAAAQMCRAVPALLTRRDELFPLARQVVRLSGFHYSKGQSQLSSTCSGRSRSESSEGAPPACGGGKRARLEGGGGATRDRGRDSAPASSGGAPQDKLYDEESMRGRAESETADSSRHPYSSSGGIWPRPDSEDGDSRYSFSNSSSPPAQDQEDSRAEGNGGARVRVVAASGDHIIAVANPALSLTLTRNLRADRECSSPLHNS